MSSNQILAFIKKFEFIAEWGILSKFPDDHQLFKEFLIFIEAVKFYFRMKKLASSNIYLETDIEPQKKNEPALLLPSDIVATKQQLERYLEEIKNKNGQKYFHNEGVTEITKTSKKISLRSNLPVPSGLRLSRINHVQILGEIIHLVRPLIYIIAVRIFGIKSYKPFMISLILDIIRLTAHRHIKVRNQEEYQELENRNREMFLKTLFRAPLYQGFTKKTIEWLLKKLINEKGYLMRIIMYFVEIRSSLTLTI